MRDSRIQITYQPERVYDNYDREKRPELLPLRKPVNDELQAVYFHHYAERVYEPGEYDIRILQLCVFIYKFEEI